MPALVLLAAALALLAPAWLRGLTPFWGDMTYIHFPWQTFTAQELQAGALPLWNPNIYFGMPAAAHMQSAVFYPGQSPFFFFGFATGTALFQLIHLWLAGWLTFLWLRSLKASKLAALAGALLFAFSGVMVSRIPFLNHLSTLSLVPAVLLFFRRPLPLTLTLACAYLAGYPPFLLGAVVLSWALWRRIWLWPGLAALALSAVQLLPAVELVRLSRRSGGVQADEMLKFGYELSDLTQWISPVLVDNFQPAVEWWKCSWLGFTGFVLVLLGLRRVKSAGLLAAAVLVLLLGGSNPVSRLLWEHLTPLHFVRYPGNLAYLMLPLAALLAAAAKPRWTALILFVELLVTAQGATPLAPRRLFTTKGDLVRDLQDKLGGRRYLLSPLALETHAGRDVFDWKTRLYGLTNSPFRLRAAGNFGEPLVPRLNYALMDRLYSLPRGEALKLMPELGIAVLLTPGGDPWNWVALKDPAPMADWPRADRFVLEGRGGGWAHIKEPRYPGWKAWLNGRPIRTEPDGIAFQKAQVPDGPWRLEFKYEPLSFRLGLWLTLLAALAFTTACYNRLLCAEPIYR